METAYGTVFIMCCQCLSRFWYSPGWQVRFWLSIWPQCCRGEVAVYLGLASCAQHWRWLLSLNSFYLILNEFWKTWKKQFNWDNIFSWIYFFKPDLRCKGNYIFRRFWCLTPVQNQRVILNRSFFPWFFDVFVVFVPHSRMVLVPAITNWADEITTWDLLGKIKVDISKYSFPFTRTHPEQWLLRKSPSCLDVRVISKTREHGPCLEFPSWGQKNSKQNQIVL
jgi:hypothetical protein